MCLPTGVDRVVSHPRAVTETVANFTSGDVRVWSVRMSDLRNPPDRFSILSADERARAVRFRFDEDRNRFVGARLALREILGRRIGVGPGEVRFEYGTHGKPAVAGQGAGIEFNVSHRKDVALIAVTTGRRIGIDVERISPVSDAEPIAARVFSRQEQASLRAVPRAAREEAFYACWTRKEAFVKAIGAGLSLPLDSFAVSLEPEEPAALLAWNGREEECTMWSLRSWCPAPGYIAALAVEGSGWCLRRAPWKVSPLS